MNRTREAGNRDEVEGVMANTLHLRKGAIGFIDWLDRAWGVLEHAADLTNHAATSALKMYR